MSKKYKLVYENATQINGSVEGVPAETDTKLVDKAEVKAKEFKLVYEANGNILGSKENKVTADDEVIISRAALEGEVE